jgi:hypothetical protein
MQDAAEVTFGRVNTKKELTTSYHIVHSRDYRLLIDRMVMAGSVVALVRCSSSTYKHSWPLSFVIFSTSCPARIHKTASCKSQAVKTKGL